MTPDVAGAWTFEVQAWSDPIGTWQHNAGLKIPAGVDVELMFTEGRLLFEQLQAEITEAHEKEVLEGAIAAAAGHRATGRGPPGGTAGPGAGRPARRPPDARAGDRRGPVPDVRRPAARAVRLLVRVLPALRGRHDRPGDRPRRQRQLPHRRSSASTTSPTMGFDVVYLPPIHPIGEVNRKGPNNTLTPGPDDTGSPWAIGSQGRRPRRDPPRPRHVRGLRRVRRPRHESRASRSRSTSRCSARPTTRGSRATPSGSPRGPTAPSPTPRTRPRSTRTSTPSTSTTTRPASAARCCASSSCGCPTACGSSGSTTRTPSRWRSGSGCLREVRAHRPRRDLPGRGVHPAGDDEHARRDRLPPVLHLLHLAHGQVGDRGLPPRALPPHRPRDAAELLRQHPRHPPRDLQYGGPAAFKIRAVLAAMRLAELGRVLRLRAVRARRRQARQRGVPRLGEVPDPGPRLGQGGGRGPHAGAVPPRAQRGPPSSTPRCSCCATSPSTAPTTRT